MLRRLGFWNRLALVAGVLFAFGMPTYTAYNDVQQASRLTTVGYEACMKNQHYVSTDGKSQFDYCWEFWHSIVKPAQPTWDDWWIGVFGFAVVALFMYGIVWIIIATGRWIWRGREAGKGPSPVRTTPLGNETD